MSKVDKMTTVSTHGTQKRLHSARPAFVVALLGSLGVAFASFHTVQPVREAFGLDPLVRLVTRTALALPRAEATELPETTLRFDRLASVQGIESPVPPVPTRRLGSGTRRAVRLAPVQMSSAGTARRPVVTVQPVVAAVLAPSRTIERPDSARRAAAALGPVHYAKLDDALRQLVDGDPAAPVRVIVQTQPGQHVTTARWLTTAGRQVHRLHPAIDGLTATLSASDVAALSEDPSIARLSIDAVVHATAEPTPGTVFKNARGLHGQMVRGRGWNGTGIRVAVVDSGIEPSRDIETRRIVGFFDFTQRGKKTRPYDDYGHGTHVAGLIGGKGRLSHGEYAGPATKASFIGFKVLDAEGAGYTSDVLGAVEYAIANNEQLKIDVMNLSLGHPIFESPETDPLVQMVERAAAAGIIVVASVGNIGLNPETGQPGYAGRTSPGNAPATINVANYLRLTGTSMTAGVTTGIVALMLDAADDWRDLVDVEPGDTSVDLGN